jgi:ketosteroid isomerase-like protein
MAHPNE